MLYAFPTTNQPKTAYINQERKKRISENQSKKETNRRKKKRKRKRNRLHQTTFSFPLQCDFQNTKKSLPNLQKNKVFSSQNAQKKTHPQTQTR